MQLMPWMEINVVKLHKVVETTPQQMRSIIKAKGGPTKYCHFIVCNFFFGQAVYNIPLLFEKSDVHSEHI